MENEPMEENCQTTSIPPNEPPFDVGRAIKKNLVKYNAQAPDLSDYSENDAGRAEMFVDVYQQQIRFVPDWGCWLLWDEHRWKRDKANSITTMAIEHHRRVQALIIESYDNPRERQQALQKTLVMGNAKQLRDMFSLASADPRIVVDSKKLDTDPDLLGLKNGVWDFKNGKIRPGRPEDLVTRQVDCCFDPEAECPLWLEFIQWATQGDDALAVFLQRMAGYTFTGHTSEEALFFHYGRGGNGKTVFCDTLHELAGEGEYGKKVQSTLYIKDRHNKIPEDQFASLEGIRLALGPELEESERLAESRVKELASTRSKINGRWQHARQTTFLNQSKLWIYGNAHPEIRGTDNGIWRRLKLIPWLAQIASDKKDQQLAQKLIATEKAGILRWVLKGAQDWMRTKSLSVPPCVTKASETYRVEEDVLSDFIQAKLDLAPALWISRQDLYSIYVEWAEASKQLAWKDKTFYRRVRQIPDVDDRERNKVRGFSGVSLKN
jgi:putative DNA primase/helicase